MRFDNNKYDINFLLRRPSSQFNMFLSLVKNWKYMRFGWHFNFGGGILEIYFANLTINFYTPFYFKST